MHVIATLILALTSKFTEGKFMGRVMDEWALDAQEFVRTKFPT
jgi:hypothetical protein